MPDLSRREALFGAIGAGLAPPASEMPRVKFGKHTVSRLIVGGNPVSGTSHLSPQLSREMVDYFTADKIKQLLRQCEEAGVNTWQSRGDRHILRLLNEYRLEGGSIQWIGQTATELADGARNIREMADMKPLGIYHHGSRTDRLWAADKIEDAREMLKVIRDTGVLVGLGTHIPEVVDYVEEKGWDVDFYMTCLYNLPRPLAEVQRLNGGPFEGEFFWDPDRERMLERVRRTRKTCLVFKVYGATRKCESPATMLEALRQVFRFAKPDDAVVIGMFPKYKDQVRENCRLVAEASLRT